jgi:hypothetical protein
MRYVLMTFHGPDHAEAWERSTAAEKQREIDLVRAWFREHREAGRIVGGEELGRSRDAKVVRRRGVHDGPFVETKERLGGFIVIEVQDEATALMVAAGWPGLDWPDDAVEVRLAGDSAAEAQAQAALEGA